MHRLRVITTFVFAAAQCTPTPYPFPFHMSCWIHFPHSLWWGECRGGNLHSMRAAAANVTSHTRLAPTVCVCVCAHLWNHEADVPPCMCVRVCVCVRACVSLCVLIPTEIEVPIMHQACADQRVNGAGWRLILRSTDTTLKSTSSNNVSIFLMVSTWENSVMDLITRSPAYNWQALIKVTWTIS